MGLGGFVTARDALERASAASRRVGEMEEMLRRLDGVRGLDYSADRGASGGDASWRLLELVERREEIMRGIDEMVESMAEVGAAIWRIDTGDPILDWEMGHALTRIYIDNASTSDVALELGTTVDGVYNLKRRGIRWLDRHGILW